MTAQGPGKNNKQTSAAASTSQDTAMGQAMDKAKQEKQAQAQQQQAAQQTQQTQQATQGTNMSQETQTQNTFATPTAMLETFRPRFKVADQGDADTNVLSAAISDIMKKAAEANGGKASDVNFHQISKTLTGSFSAIAVSVSLMVNNTQFTAVHTLIMEASRPPLDNLTQQTPTGAIEVVLSPVEAYTPEFIAVVHKEVAGFYKLSSQIVEAGMQVIYRETPIKDENAVAAILNEATQAIDATLRLLDPREKQNRFSLTRIVGNQSARITSKFSLNDDIVQPNGLPVRSDITAELQLQQTSNKQQTIQSTTTTALSKSAAYVDLIFVGGSQAINPYGQQGGFGGAIQPGYVPRITMTQLGTEMAGSPMEFTLLGIANMTSLNRNRAYGIQWRDSYNKGNAGSLRNLGAIGWQMPQLNIVDGQPSTLQINSDLELQQLIQVAIHASPVYSLEVEQAGHNGWLLEGFAQAAAGNGAANKMIVDAADALTGNRFRPIFARNSGVALEQVQNVQVIRATQDLNHVGYYKNAQGEYADLRELDLLAVLNIANGNIELVRDYLSTVVATAGEHPLQRLDKRLRIFRSICSEVVVKGYTTKYDFNGLFIKSLIEAIEATGFVLNANNTLLTSQQQVYTQTLQDWSSVMVDANIGNGLYQTQTFSPNGQVFNVGQNMGYGYFQR